MTPSPYSCSYQHMYNKGLVTSSDPVTTDNGDNATLSCKFSGYLPRNPTFSWENSQGVISDDNNFTIQSSVESGQTVLTIRSVILTDSGNYTCRMRGDNNAELSGIAELFVVAIPSVTAKPTTTSKHYNPPFYFRTLELLNQ